MSFPAMTALALLIDAALGWPALIYVRIGYPVTWIGALIDALENRWNDRNLMRPLTMGAFCVGLVMGAVILPAVRVKCCCRQACAA